MFCQQTKPRAGVAKISSDGEKLFVTTMSKAQLHFFAVVKNCERWSRKFIYNDNNSLLSFLFLFFLILPKFTKIIYDVEIARVAELVYAPVLGTGLARDGGSSPLSRTIKRTA